MPTGGEWWIVQRAGPPGGHPPYPRDVLLVRRRAHHPRDGRSRSPATSNFEVAKHDWELARELGIRISVHVGMRLPQPLHYTPVKNMHDLGLMGPDVATSTDRLDRRGARPDRRDRRQGVDRAVRRDADGPRAAADRAGSSTRGVRPSLSVDVVSSVPGEMFTQMRTALVYDADPRFTDTPDEAFAPKLTHRTCSSSRRSTARARCALEDRVGSLTPRQAGRHRPAERQRDQHGADGRPDRDDRRLLRHVERRLGVRRRAAP